MIDAYKERMISIFDISSAYLHAKMEHKDKFVDLMCEPNSKYIPYVKVINGRKVLYLMILRVLYGCIESALLWYNLLCKMLQEMGFVEINPQNKCVAKKTVNGEQCRRQCKGVT